MTPLLSVYAEDGERLRRNNSSHSLLGNFLSSVRTATLLVMFSVALLGGCASDHSSEHRSSKQPPSDRTFFDSPDIESLH